MGRIEAELQAKEEEVAVLSEKIGQLTERLENLSYSKYCAKCNAALSHNSALQINVQDSDVLEKEQAGQYNPDS